LVLGLLTILPSAFAGEKFLRVKGELIDELTKEPLLNFKIKQVEDDLDSTVTSFDGSDFDLWVSPNRTTKLFFIKENYVINFMLIDASFIPSIAYKKKQKIELLVKMNKATERVKRNIKPSFKAEYIPKLNAFEVNDMSLKKNQKPSPNYKPPFPSPADTYSSVKPTINKLELTSSINERKTKGNTGIARVLQGILFADLNYCLFNERTNDANNYLDKLKAADMETWGNVKPFDSPEYGKIVARTINREQSVDTLFALGAHLETSRLIYQNFTSDTKVLIHLKTLKKVLQDFEASAPSPIIVEFMSKLNDLIPTITHLESTYKEQLKNKMNFEMESNEDFLSIQKSTAQIYQAIIS
jgi:hypothetical protein